MSYEYYVMVGIGGEYVQEPKKCIFSNPVNTGDRIILDKNDRDSEVEAVRIFHENKGSSVILATKPDN